nr:wall-associated receptor kinase 2-like [Tanacetum cinerariifolium]
MRTNTLFQILDPRVVREGSLEQLQAIASLVKRCLSMNGYDRPTMKEVAMEIERLRKFTKQPWVNQHGSEDGFTRNNEEESSDLYVRSLSDFTISKGQHITVNLEQPQRFTYQGLEPTIICGVRIGSATFR